MAVIRSARPSSLILLLVACSVSTLPDLAFSQGSAFTYQGRLNSGGTGANGNYDFRFDLYPDDGSVPPGGAAVGGPILYTNVFLSNGLFTVALDFGAVFSGNDRWLQISVGTNGAGSFTALSPRQRLTPTPYAITAANLTGVLPNAALMGTYTNVVVMSNPGNQFSGNGAALTNISGFVPSSLNATSVYAAAMPSAGGTNSQILVFNSGTNTSGIFFGNTNATGGYIVNLTTHGGDPSDPSTWEMGLVAPGKMALVPLAGNIQIGGYGIGNPSLEMYVVRGKNGEDIYSAGNSLGYSTPAGWHAYLNSNGVVYAHAPALFGQGLNPNGSYELSVTADLWNSDGTRGTANDWNARKLAGFYAGGVTRGVNLRGGLVQEKTNVTIALTNCPLNFASAASGDITAGCDALSFYTTNRTGARTDYERRIFVIRAGVYSPTLSWPINWTWLTNGTDVTPPDSLLQGQLLRLELESFGPGESNIIASVRMGTDTGFFFDTDASNFFTRAGITNRLTKTAVNTLVVDLKDNNLWNKFTNGFIYPFAGAGPTNCAVNLVSSNYTITWHGALGFTNGVTGDGITGYGDTGFRPDLSGMSASNMCMWAYAGTNHSAAYGTTMMGAYNNVAFDLRYSFSGLPTFVSTGFGTTRHAILGSNIVANDPNVLVNVTNNTDSTVFQLNTATTASGFGAPALDNADVYLLNLNAGPGAGSPATEWFRGTLKAAAFGQGMSRAQIATWFSIWNNYMATMGRTGLTNP
jgi:hypothetical protein